MRWPRGKGAVLPLAFGAAGIAIFFSFSLANLTLIGAESPREHGARIAARRLSRDPTFAKTSPTPVDIGTQTILYYTLIISIGGNPAGYNARSGTKFRLSGQ
jgi:hypothetical protein